MPIRPLPDPGVQPHNPGDTEAQIHERHALLVDMWIPPFTKPAGSARRPHRGAGPRRPDSISGSSRTSPRPRLHHRPSRASPARPGLVPVHDPRRKHRPLPIVSASPRSTEQGGPSPHDDLPGPRPGGRVVVHPKSHPNGRGPTRMGQLHGGRWVALRSPQSARWPQFWQCEQWALGPSLGLATDQGALATFGQLDEEFQPGGGPRCWRAG